MILKLGLILKFLSKNNIVIVGVTDDITAGSEEKLFEKLLKNIS